MKRKGYSQDYDKTLPFRTAAISGVEVLQWRMFVQPYIKSFNVMRCPSNPRGREFSLGNTEWAASVGNVGLIECGREA